MNWPQQSFPEAGCISGYLEGSSFLPIGAAGACQSAVNTPVFYLAGQSDKPGLVLHLENDVPGIELCMSERNLA